MYNDDDGSVAVLLVFAVSIIITILILNVARPSPILDDKKDNPYVVTRAVNTSLSTSGQIKYYSKPQGTHMSRPTPIILKEKYSIGDTIYFKK